MSFSGLLNLLKTLRNRWEIYFVGGVVRDWVIKGGKDFRVKDCDLVLVGNVEVLKKVSNFLREKGFKVRKFSWFGTVELEFKGTNVDIALARREFYKFPGALPEVEFVDNIKEDVVRRDFTINSLYYDGNMIYDFVGGLEDLERKVLKPVASFVDDPTRIFRGLRYKNLLSLRYDEKFFRFMETGKPYIRNLSEHRILNEFRLVSVLSSRALKGFFKEAREYGLLETITYNFKKPNWWRFLVGKPNPHRWIIMVAPFVKNLPLTSLETKCKEILKVNLRHETYEGIHRVFHDKTDIEVLSYINWKAKDKKTFLKYLKFRKGVRVPLYPITERINRLKEFIGNNLPDFAFYDPENHEEKGNLKAKLEALVIKHISSL